MFEFIRTHQKLMQIVLAVLILPSFVFFGISGYRGMSGANDAVATVAGQPITQQEWERALREQMDRYRQSFGAQFDPKMFDTPEMKQQLLDGLVAQRALAAEIDREHLTVNDASLASFYAERLKKPDGSFDIDQYKALAAAQGLTTQGLDAMVRRDMTQQQIVGAVENTAFVPRAVSARLSDFAQQEREVQELLFPAANYVSQVKVTDDMIKAYYDKNAAMFQVPEQAKIEYVVFDSAAVESQVTVSDSEIADYYKTNIKHFETPEQRRAAHILITVKKDASPAEKDAAKAKAEALLAQVKKSPGDFAKIAKANSQDPGSAENGGDLGVVEKGTFVKPVEDAIYKLKQGEISDLVQSEFGWHIITVTSLKPASTRTLDEAKADVIAEIKKQKMSKKYSELADEFTNTVEEQFDSLKPVADKLKLKIETVPAVTRTPNPALGQAPFNNAKFLQAVFSDDALKNKRNTRAIEVAPSTLIAGHVVEYKPATKRPLAEVESVIRERVTQEEAAKLAKAAGEAKLAAVKTSNDAAGFSDTKLVTRTKAPTIPPAAAQAVLKADVSKLPAFVGVEIPGQGYGVYRINKVQQPAQVDPERRKGEAQQMASAAGQQEMYAYVEALKVKAKAKINKLPASSETKEQ